jgi:DEAD/DEAH box helicase domain-containing protein
MANDHPYNEAVLDIETSNTFQEVGGYHHDKLKISVIGVYFYETDEYICYEVDELSELWPRLEQADRLIGYNTEGFDFPVMNNYYAGDFMTFPSLDMLVNIKEALGFRLKLDDVAESCLGEGKTGHGLDAVDWWRNGEKEKVKQYCLDDVRVTKGVYEYGLKHGALAYEDRFGERKGIPVDFALKQEDKERASNINLTMPI